MARLGYSSFSAEQTPLVNASEAFVHHLCARTFLSLWSVAEPRGDDGDKELCDVIVVCDPDVIVFSVKEIEYKETDNGVIGIRRWTKRAVTESLRQIRGAERALKRIGQIRMRDGSPSLLLPPLMRRRVHRIAVALGSKGEVPISESGSKGAFVHVFDERGFETTITELDTIADFVAFLSATEQFLEKSQMIVVGAENLLGLYLQQGRQFPGGADLLVVTDDIWTELSGEEAFRRKKDADKESYLWDSLIERLVNDSDPSLTTAAGAAPDIDNGGIERVARVMARESRFNRRILAKAFIEFHVGGGIRSRIARSPSGVTYVFLVRPHGWSRDARTEELLARMFIARGRTPGANEVVGLATEAYVQGAGSSLDAALLSKPDWTPEDESTLLRLQAETGAFAKPQWSQSKHDEYPDV
jgi:hypothetical protein